MTSWSTSTLLASLSPQIRGPWVKSRDLDRATFPVCPCAALGRGQPRFPPRAGISRETCGHQKEGVSQAVAPGTAPDCGTLSFIGQVPLDAEETVAVEKAGGGGALRGFPRALSPSPRGAPESRVPWPREDKPSRFCRKLSGDGRPWPDTLMWKPCWFCPLVLAAGTVPLLDTSLPLHGARWLLPLS